MQVTKARHTKVAKFLNQMKKEEKELQDKKKQQLKEEIKRNQLAANVERNQQEIAKMMNNHFVKKIQDHNNLSFRIQQTKPRSKGLSKHMADRFVLENTIGLFKGAWFY